MRSQLSGHRFVVDVDPIPDALVRVLGPFAVQQVTVARVRHDQTACAGCAVLEVQGMEPDRADLLARRLEQLPFVRSVTLEALRAEAQRLASVAGATRRAVSSSGSA